MRRVRVGDVLHLQRRAVSIDPATEYRLIGVYSFGKGIFHREPKIGAELGNYKFFAVEPGDLVLSNIQAWEGAIGFATGADRGTIGTHRFLAYTAIDPDEIDTNWARYFFLSEAGFPLIQKAAPGSVTRNRTLAVERFEALEIPLPDIDDQRRIAAHLDHVASRATRLRDLHSGASETAQAAAQATALRLDLTEPERIEAGWEHLPMSALLALDVTIVEVASQSSFRLAGVLSFGRGAFLRGELHQGETKYKQLHRLGAGQVVMSRLKAWEGAIAVVPADLDGAVASTEFPTFTIRQNRATPEFLQALVQSRSFWALLAGGSKGVGARRERVSAERLLSTSVWVPPIEEQVAAARQLKAIWDVERRTAGRSSVIAALLPSALNRSFAGLA